MLGKIDALLIQESDSIHAVQIYLYQPSLQTYGPLIQVNIPFSIYKVQFWFVFQSNLCNLCMKVCVIWFIGNSKYLNADEGKTLTYSYQLPV